MNQNETLNLIAQAKKYTYPEYVAVVKEQLETNTPETVPYYEYTKLNVQRMKRLDKTPELTPEVTEALKNLNRNLTWTVLTEGWCGDAAQNVPVLARIAEASGGKITLQLVLRDQNLELMDRYLTNNGRSIPKLICFDSDTQEELGSWGPRPAEAQEMFKKLKSQPELTMDEFAEKLHGWYNANKTQNIQQEFVELLRQWQK